MLKFAMLLFNTLALLIYQFLFTEDVTVTQKVPSSAKAGSEFTVVLTINKGSSAGFAKLQLELPAGFSAVEDKNSGASFSFSNQAVKFIWMSLPNDPTFTVSYKVKVDAGLSGDQVIAGKFAYVTDNAKQTTQIDPATITIGSEGLAVETPTDAPADSPADNPTDTPTDATTDTPTDASSTTKSIAAEGTLVTVARNVPASASGEFTVSITVNKANLSGFAKLMESLPYGFTATAVETAGASFFADQKARFIWVTLPAQPEFKISYKVTAADVTGDQTIDGVFSYIENDETKKKVIDASTVLIGAEGDVVKNTDTKDPVNTTKDPVNTTKEPTYEALQADKVPVPQGNVNYRVQILALLKARSADAVANIFNINQTVNTEMADGFRKYTVGSFSEYKQARDSRETYRPKGVVAPFVTAYNRGKRTTVQDALMVTNQKWFR